jgi:quercetin dioxygenase-like cupin family protein
MVRYEPGARTHWHSHSGGQMLYVVEGEGWVQTRGEAPRRVGPGDAISFVPDEVHWHGATARGPMAHVTVTAGKPTWYEVSDAPLD